MNDVLFKNILVLNFVEFVDFGRMASNGGEQIFASVAAKSINDTRKVKVSRTDVEKCKNIITRRSGVASIVPPEEFLQGMAVNTVVFRCVNKVKNNLMKPSLAEVQPTFENIWTGLKSVREERSLEQWNMYSMRSAHRNKL